MIQDSICEQIEYKCSSFFSITIILSLLFQALMDKSSFLSPHDENLPEFQRPHPGVDPAPQDNSQQAGKMQNIFLNFVDRFNNLALKKKDPENLSILQKEMNSLLGWFSQKSLGVLAQINEQTETNNSTRMEETEMVPNIIAFDSKSLSMNSHSSQQKTQKEERNESFGNQGQKAQNQSRESRSAIVALSIQNQCHMIQPGRQEKGEFHEHFSEEKKKVKKPKKDKGKKKSAFFSFSGFQTLQEERKWMKDYLKSESDRFMAAINAKDFIIAQNNTMLYEIRQTFRDMERQCELLSEQRKEVLGQIHDAELQRLYYDQVTSYMSECVEFLMKEQQEENAKFKEERQKMMRELQARIGENQLKNKCEDTVPKEEYDCLAEKFQTLQVNCKYFERRLKNHQARERREKQQILDLKAQGLRNEELERDPMRKQILQEIIRSEQMRQEMEELQSENERLRESEMNWKDRYEAVKRQLGEEKIQSDIEIENRALVERDNEFLKESLSRKEEQLMKFKDIVKRLEPTFPYTLHSHSSEARRIQENISNRLTQYAFQHYPTMQEASQENDRQDRGVIGSESPSYLDLFLVATREKSFGISQKAEKF